MVEEPESCNVELSKGLDRLGFFIGKQLKLFYTVINVRRPLFGPLLPGWDRHRSMIHTIERSSQKTAMRYKSFVGFTVSNHGRDRSVVNRIFLDITKGSRAVRVEQSRTVNAFFTGLIRNYSYDKVIGINHINNRCRLQYHSSPSQLSDGQMTIVAFCYHTGVDSSYFGGTDLFFQGNDAIFVIHNLFASACDNCVLHEYFWDGRQGIILVPIVRTWLKIESFSSQRHSFPISNVEIENPPSMKLRLLVFFGNQ